jgi:carboxyl-terminal processing protease
VVNLLHLSGYFLGKDEPLGTFVGRALVRRYEEKTGDKSSDVLKVAAWEEASRLRAASRTERYEGTVAVLINAGTGSASEMMAAALREYRGAKVVGAKSAGAVLASYMWPIKEGFTLQFPVTDYVTIKGLRIEGTGIVPDVLAETSARYGEEDKALTAALKSISG